MRYLRTEEEILEAIPKRGSYTFITSSKISRCWMYYDFYGLMITGPQGVGKSTYAIKVMLDLYYNNWDIVKKYIVFSITDLIKLFLSTDRRLLCVLWDDAGVYGHKYLRSTKIMQYLQGVIDTIRTKCAGFLLTVPNPDELVKIIRLSPGFRVGRVTRISRPSSTERLVNVYQREFFPPFVFYKKIYIDAFKVRLPDDIYREYTEMRNSFYEKASKRALPKFLEKLSEEEPEEIDKLKEIKEKYIIDEPTSDTDEENLDLDKDEAQEN